MSLTRCPVVVGRGAEIAEARSALLRAARGEGGVLMILGEAGIGKTRLAVEVEAIARDRGMRVLRGRAVEGDVRIPYRPLAEALQAAFRSEPMPSDPALAAFRPALGKLLPQWAPPAVAAETSFLLLFEALVRLLSVAARPHGALVVLEDLQWADADTVSAVEYLAEQLPGTRCLCLVTVRSDEPSPGVRGIVRLADRSPSAALRLSRLPPGEALEMARRCLEDRPASAELADAVVERAEGIPLLVEELLTAYVQADGTVAAGLPESYASIVQRRLDLLDDSALAVVEAAAAVGLDADVEVLGVVTGLAPGVVLGALRAAREANLLVHDPVEPGRLAFRHALVADAIVARLLPMERRDLYRRAAAGVERALPGLPGVWCERVANLRERGEDPQGAFVLLTEAGRRAIKRGTLLTAEQTLERARALAQGDRWRTTGVDRLLVHVLALLGKSDRMRELARAALSFMEPMPDLLGTPERIGEIHLQYAVGLAAVHDWAMAGEHIARVHGLAGSASDARLGCRARALESRVAYQLGEHARAAKLAAPVLTEGERMDLPQAAGEARRVLARCALVKGDIAGARRLLEDAKRIAERRDLTLDRIEALLELARMDEATSGSFEQVESAAKLAAVTEAPLPQVRVELLRAGLLLARFELAEAEIAVKRTVAACRRHTFPLLPEALAVAAQLAALRGDRAAVRSYVGELQRLRGATERVHPGVSAAKAVLAVVDADIAGAAAAVAEVSTPDPCGPYAWCVGLRSLVAAVSGDAVPSPAARATGTAMDSLLNLAEVVVAGRAGDVAGATAGFHLADEALAPFPWRRQVARRLVASAALADRWGMPESWLAEAETFFDGAGHRALAASCRGLVRRAGGVVPRKGRGSSVVPERLRRLGVTSREMDILMLVREGLSNQDIADRLVLSVRTVESHVGSAMRKTGVRNRAGLVALVVESP